jgi:hypothetical protein
MIPRSWFLYADWFVRYLMIGGALAAVWHLPLMATVALLATVTILNNVLVPRDAKLFPPDFNGDPSLLPGELEASITEGYYTTRDGVVLKYRRSGSGPKTLILGTLDKPAGALSLPALRVRILLCRAGNGLGCLDAYWIPVIRYFHLEVRSRPYLPSRLLHRPFRRSYPATRTIGSLLPTARCRYCLG